MIKGALNIQKLYNLKGEITLNTTKNLVRRLGLIEKLKKLQRFGILVSNPNT
jgi:hypothetical protein